MIMVEENQFEELIDKARVERSWREFTDPPAQRPNRYDAGQIAAYTWLFMDKFAEWSRHRGADAQLQ